MINNRSTAPLALMAVLARAPAAAFAQTAAPPVPPVAAQTAPAAAPQPTAAATTRAKSAASRACTRLPLSDIQVGRDETIRVARIRLGEYADKVAKARGWKAYDKSAETVACEDYLFVPLLGQEYKCLVTATFCAK